MEGQQSSKLFIVGSIPTVGAIFRCRIMVLRLAVNQFIHVRFVVAELIASVV